MWRRLLLIVFVALSFVILSPQESWSQRLVDRHDCVKNKRGGFKCVRGPLAGKTFKSDRTMIRALTQGFGPLERTKPVLKTKKRVKKAKSKKARMKKARIKKAKSKKARIKKAKSKKARMKKARMKKAKSKKARMKKAKNKKWSKKKRGMKKRSKARKSRRR